MRQGAALRKLMIVHSARMVHANPGQEGHRCSRAIISSAEALLLLRAIPPSGRKLRASHPYALARLSSTSLGAACDMRVSCQPKWDQSGLRAKARLPSPTVRRPAIASSCAAGAVSLRRRRVARDQARRLREESPGMECGKHLPEHWILKKAKPVCHVSSHGGWAARSFRWR